MKTYFVKCTKHNESIDPKMFRTKYIYIYIYICNQNVLFAELKSQDL